MDLKEFTSPLPKPWLNIRANSVVVGPSPGGPAVSCVYSQVGLTTITNTSSVLSLASNSAAVGSQQIGPLPVGAVVRLKAYANITYGTATNGYVAWFLLDNTQLVKASDNNGGEIKTPTPVVIEAAVTILSATQAAVSLSMNIAGSTAGGSGSSVIALDSTLSHDFDLGFGFQFAAGNNTLTCQQFTEEILAGTVLP